jgi:hypothetical protein
MTNTSTNFDPWISASDDSIPGSYLGSSQNDSSSNSRVYLCASDVDISTYYRLDGDQANAAMSFHHPRVGMPMLVQFIQHHLSLGI